MTEKRHRNIGHMWADKRIMRFFRKNFGRSDYKNLRSIYLALCEIDSDFTSDEKIGGFTKTVSTYAGMSLDTVYKYLPALRAAGLIDYVQENVQGRFGQSKLTLFKWEDSQKDEYEQVILKTVQGENRTRKKPRTVESDNGKIGCNENPKGSMDQNPKGSMDQDHCPTEEPEDQSGFWQDKDQDQDPRNVRYEEKETNQEEGNHTTAKQAMVAEENKTVYLPLASKLAGIVQSKKNIRFTPSKIQSWANEIKRLVKTDGITAERIYQALDWYETNIGGEYVPVVESGASLRQKFLRLEAAIERDASYHRATAPPPAADSSRNGNSAPAITPGPRRLIQEYIGDRTLTKAFIQDCLKPAESLLSNGNGGLNRDEQSKLAHKLISLHRQIIQAQDQHFTNSLREVLPYYGPMELVGTYVTWIRDSDWIDHPSSNMLDISHSLFSRFKREYSRQIDHLARDPLTGQPDVRE